MHNVAGMETSPAFTARQYRTLVALLGGIAALLLLLVLGLGAGGLYALKTVRTLTGRQGVQETERDVAARQAAFQKELGEYGESTLATLDGFKQRRAALEDTSGGPLKKIELTVRLNQLMADELLVMLRTLAGLEVSVAHGARPLPTERPAARARQAPRANPERGHETPPRDR